MKTVSLLVHPTTPCPEVSEIRVDIARPSAKQLSFKYTIHGDIGRLQLPASTSAARAHELWKHSCCEAFIRRPRVQAYYELNFSPSSEWAAYRFDDYRAAMAAVPLSSAPDIACSLGTERFEMDVHMPLDSLEGLADAELQLAVCAVIQTNDQRMSYWALAHPAAKPDFHHRDAFTLTLAPHDGDSR